MEGLVNKITQGIMHREDIDVKALRAHVLSIVICSFVALTIFLVYYLIKDYIECILLAVLSSMLLRPIKAWTQTQVKELAESQDYFPTSRWSFCCLLTSMLLKRKKNIGNYAMFEGKWDSFWVVICAFCMYVAWFKVRFPTLCLVLIGLVMLDVVVRFGLDLFSMLIKLSGWNTTSNAHKVDRCSSFFSILLLFLSILCSFSLLIAVVVPTALEIQDQGSVVMGKIQGLGFNLTTEGVTAMVMRYVEDKGGVKAWTGFESFQSEAAVNGTVTEIMTHLQAVPWVGQQLIETWQSWESKLIGYGLPVANILEFLTENINEISFYTLQTGMFLWSVFVTSATSIFSSFFDFIYCSFLYLTLVFFLVTRETSILTSILSILPVGAHVHTRVEKELSTNVTQIFVTIIKVAVTYSLCTYILFDRLDLPLKYTASTLTGLAGFIQLLDPWVIALPWFIYLLVSGFYYRAAAVGVVEYFVLSYCYVDIYSRTVTGLNVTILTLASVFGLSNFGALGVLYGPLIAGLINVFMSLMQGLQSPSE